MKTTIFLFHPNIQESKTNAALIKGIGVEVRDIYKLYPDGEINVKREQEALLQADRIILQFPMYWFSSPSLLKEWQDLVLEHGWAYGSQGHALEGKEVMITITMGVLADEYQPNGKQKHTVDEYLLPVKATMKYVGMTYLKPFIVSGAFYLNDEQRDEYAFKYRQVIQKPNYSKN
ncbi:NAD(P)H-dependent oxidoreductase [Limosilactobacillus sp. RRLNB_1_1]|uniref:NAD(P)H-dependent oxidoreductase n=1 Tax=Limosilactobacillus albertensis TaxID=2759752 RepID=A0A7W3TQH7_9LACO|nr:NAD(P)H-dependent oxidoreductase [Limosilactobacillus albertensis]MBB1068898.1 NAD(P)H-dependent oxidoreductase [Limosilactobacillus albertensis]MCD7118658.1 NAD(P)H-dependent oxidoreductase [Limosilactobacillus albertensis]MCD7128193.1 NAD(P)H-dependent oxidoreductase [Limosilactobacillus albertensis]